jgi:hypothetical protein
LPAARSEAPFPLFKWVFLQKYCVVPIDGANDAFYSLASLKDMFSLSR